MRLQIMSRLLFEFVKSFVNNFFCVVNIDFSVIVANRSNYYTKDIHIHLVLSCFVCLEILLF